MKVVRRLAKKFGYIPESEARKREIHLRDESFRAATIISEEVLPVLAKGLNVPGDDEHKRYVRVVQALERLGY